jgi:flagellar hook-basal body complex protein FliE
MEIGPMPSTGLPVQNAGGLAAGPTSPAGGLFSRVLGQFLGQLGQQQVQSKQAVQDLALGRTDNLHSVVLEVAKADVGFRMFLETRNRLSDAYQEIMKMQV